MGGNAVGEIPVLITGDYSGLIADLQIAENLAAQGATQIGASFTSAARGSMDLDEAIKLLTADGLEFDQGTKTATQDVSSFADVLKNAAAATDQAGQAASTASGSIAGVGSAAQGASESTKGLDLNVGSLVKSFAAFAGVQLTLQGLKSALDETFTSFAQLQRATESLTALTGSAKLANDEIAQMRVLAQDEALSFPSLLKAAQQMAAFGISTKQSTELLAAAGDASRATGRDFDSVASSVQRIVESGAAMGRTLQGVGLTTADLGNVMGVTSGAASKLFKALDESTRVDIITAALAKFKGLASDTANDLTGSWQQLSNAAKAEFAKVGSELEGTGRAFTAFATASIAAIGSVAEFFINFGKGIASTAGDITNSLKNAAATWGISFDDYAAASKRAADSNKNFEQSTGTMAIAARQLFAGFPEYNTQLSALEKQLQQGAIDGSTFTTRLLSMEGQFKSLHPTIGTTTDATKTYTQAVADLKQKLADGDITQQQYNASLKALEAQHGATSKAVKDHVLSLADLSAKEAQATADVQQSLTVWSSARAIYEQTGQGVGLLNAAYDQMTAALKRAKEGFSDLSLTIISSSKAQGEAFGNFQKGFGDGAVAIIQKQKDLEAAASAAATTFNQLAAAYKQTGDYGIELQTATDALGKALTAAGLDASDLDVKLKLIGTDAIPIITGGTQKLVSTSGDLDTTIKSVNQSLRDMGVTGGQSIQIIQGGVSKTVDLMDGFKSATDQSANGIQILKGGVLAATSAHQQLNDTASKLPTILNADATTMEHINALIVTGTTDLSKMVDEAGALGKNMQAAADGFLAFEQAAQDRMDANAKGGGLLAGAQFFGAGLTQATGSAGAEGGGTIHIPTPFGTIAGTPFGPNRTPASPAPAASSATTPAATQPDSGAVQALNAQLQQMFSAMADAGQVDVNQLNALASTLGEFVTVDAQGLHIAWQQATTATTSATQATNTLTASSTAASAAVAGFSVDAAAASTAITPLAPMMASFGTAVLQNTDALKAEFQSRTTILTALNQWITQFNAANAQTLATAYQNNPNQRFLATAPLAQVNIPTGPTGTSSSQLLGGGTQITINNPVVTDQTMLDRMVQQLRNLGV